MEICYYSELQELNLCGCARITDLTLTHAVCFKELRSLNLSHCQQVNVNQ